MNHLEDLTAEWLDYNGYFTRTGIRVGRRERGGYDGELDVIGYHPDTGHFIHVECSMDALTWDKREERFTRKLAMGKEYARGHFAGMNVPEELDQVVVLGFASATEAHRKIGGGRLLTSHELITEILNGVPPRYAQSAVPENFPLLRTVQLAYGAGARIEARAHTLIPRTN